MFSVGVSLENDVCLALHFKSSLSPLSQRGSLHIPVPLMALSPQYSCYLLFELFLGGGGQLNGTFSIVMIKLCLR